MTKISKLEGWGNLSINNLKKSIDKSKKIFFDKFIFSIGVRHIGQENAKILAEFFGSIKELEKLFDKEKINTKLQNLKDLDGIGETQITSIRNFFLNKINLKIIKNLIKELNINDYSIKITDGKFSNKS